MRSTRAAVDASSCSVAGSPPSTGASFTASSFPSSTPHWSNESIPHTAPREDHVLVERDERPERERCEPLEEKERRRSVARHHLVRDEAFGDPRQAQLLRRPAERERLCLRERVRQQEVVVLAERHDG